MVDNRKLGCFLFYNNLKSHIYRFSVSKDRILIDNYYKNNYYKNPDPEGVYIMIRNEK